MITLTQYSVIGDQLALAWGDGQETFIGLKDLRVSCPCAVCQGEPDAMGRVVKPKVVHTERSFQLVGMKQLGGYALHLIWADGHKSGIYAFDFLRDFG